MKKIFPYALMTLTIILAFAPAFDASYLHWDDGKHIINNPRVWGGLSDNIVGIFTQHINSTYIPLTTLSFNIEHKLVGLNPAISHGINICLHIIVVFLAFRLALALGLTPFIALLGSLIFGLHPMHVESVAWVTERKDVLYAGFYLASILCYINYLKTTGKLFFFGCLLAALLSILAKPMAVSLPWVLLIIDWWFKRPFSFKLWLEKIPAALIVFPLALLTFFKLSPHPNLLWPDALLIALWSLMFYIIKFIFPYPLLPLYIPPEPINLANSVYLISLMTLLICFVLIYWLRRQRLVIFSFIWWFASIFFFTRVNFADINIVADRFMYLPSLGFCLCAAWGIEQSFKKFKFNLLRNVVSTSLIIILGAMTFYQTYQWQDDQTLWRHVLKHEPKNSLARKKINVLLYKPQQKNLDTHVLDKSIKENPNQATLYHQRGLSYVLANQEDLALADFNTAIRLSPHDTQGYINRGTLLEWLGNNDLALKDFNHAIWLNPQEAAAYINRAIIYTKQRQYTLALSDLNKAIDLNPKAPTAYYRRGTLWMSQQAWQNALNDFTKTLTLDNNNIDGHYQKAIVLKQLNRLPEAINHLNTVIQLDPSNTEAMNDLGVLWLLSGNTTNAVNSLNKALTLDAFNHQLYVNRANAWLKLHDFNKAVDDLTQAINLSHQPWKYLITRGDIYMAQGAVSKAREDFELARQWAPHEPLVLFKLARVAYEQQRYQTALNYLNACIKLDKDDPNNYLARELVYKKINQGK